MWVLTASPRYRHTPPHTATPLSYFSPTLNVSTVIVSQHATLPNSVEIIIITSSNTSLPTVNDERYTVELEFDILNNATVVAGAMIQLNAELR